VGELGLAQATVSQHLKELKKVGIIKGNISGTSTCYCIDREKWGEIFDTMSQFFSKINSCETC
jgi:DNA-binding transcriptional ArsR family regulator